MNPAAAAQNQQMQAQQHAAMVQQQAAKKQHLTQQSKQFNAQEKLDPIITFKREMDEMKICLDELMTLSAETLTLNTDLDNGNCTESTNENKTIEFSKRLEQFYRMTDNVQLLLKQSKEQLLVTLAAITNMPQPSSSSNKDAYQSYIDTIKCQVNDAKQIHNLFKDLSNKLACPVYNNDIYLGSSSRKRASPKAGSGKTLLSGPAITIDNIDYASVLANEEKTAMDLDNKERLERERQEEQARQERMIKQQQQQQQQNQQTPHGGPPPPGNVYNPNAPPPGNAYPVYPDHNAQQGYGGYGAPPSVQSSHGNPRSVQPMDQTGQPPPPYGYNNQPGYNIPPSPYDHQQATP